MSIATKLITVSFFTCIVFYTGIAQTKNSLAVKGLTASVEVLRDQWGVNHIYALNQHDLFFAQGYCAAKDRLFQFEVWRRQATGTVAEILGAPVILPIGKVVLKISIGDVVCSTLETTVEMI